MPSTAYALAHLADVASPDRLDSPGAHFLLTVAEAVAELADADEDSADEVADAAVPVYTADLWAAFVDLAAYREDVSEYGAVDLTRSASLALYGIGRRLAATLLEQRRAG